MANWYVWREGRDIWRNGWEEGPLTPNQMREQVRAGNLKPIDRVRREGSQDYVQASSVKGLFVEVGNANRKGAQQPVKATDGSFSGSSNPSAASVPSIPAGQGGNQASEQKSESGCFETGCGLFVIGILVYGGLICSGFVSSPFKARKPSAVANPIQSSRTQDKVQGDFQYQLVELNSKIQEWKSKRDKLAELLSKLEQDKKSLVSQLKGLGASATDQKSTDPKVSILLVELRDVLKQKLIFEKKHQDYDLAVFKSESRVRTFERRISAEEVADNDEELTGLIRSMAELDQTLDSENQAEVPIELDAMINEALSGSSN
jgi:hypothetical protein